MKKDLVYLNTKWWYRLIKIIFIFINLILMISIISIIFHSNSPKFNIMDEKTQLVHNAIEFAKQNPDTEYATELRKRIEDGAYDRELNILNQRKNYNNYEVNSKYEYEGRNWRAIIGFSLITIISVLIFFELIRRVFYYIILGSFLPDKPKKYLFLSIKYKE